MPLAPCAQRELRIEAEQFLGFTSKSIIQPNSVHGMPKNHARSAVWN